MAGVGEGVGELNQNADGIPMIVDINQRPLPGFRIVLLADGTAVAHHQSEPVRLDVTTTTALFTPAELSVKEFQPL